MKGITNVVMPIVLFVKQQSQIQDTGVTSNRIQGMKMIILLHVGRIPISILEGKVITVHGILVSKVIKHIENFFNFNIKSSSNSNIIKQNSCSLKDMFG